MTTSTFDRDTGHRHFAAHCFNETWTLLDKTERTPDDERLMIAAAHASIYHWLHRADHTPQHLSVGYWQIARVYTVLGRAAEALYYAELCQTLSPTLAPFYRGYALEALARAAALAGQTERAAQAKREAMQILAEIEDISERDMLSQDLATTIVTPQACPGED